MATTTNAPSPAPPSADAPGAFQRFQASLNENHAGVFAGLCALYLAAVTALGSIKLLWFDEFITFYISKLNSVNAIWDALAQGADPNPPGSHLLVMWSMRIFGESALALRFPAVVAGFVSVVALYLFLRPRVPVIYVAAGVSFFLATDAFAYFYEARSYSLLLVFAILSLVFWRGAVEGRYPTLNSAALAVSLAAGISSNYYGVLAFCPIAAGELVRTIERRKLSFRVWLALLVGGLPILLYLPLINHSIERFSPYAWNKPSPRFVPDSYWLMIEEIFIPAALLIAVGTIAWIYERASHIRTLPAVLPRHESVAVIVLIGYPVLGYLIAVLRAGMISPRCVIPMCFGFAIAIAVMGFRLFQRSAVGAVLLFAVCFGWFVVRDFVVGGSLVAQRQALWRVRDSLPKTGTLIVSDSLLSTPLHYYSPKEIGSRIVFPIDFDSIRRYKTEDSPEQNLWAGRHLYPFPILQLEQLKETYPYYVVVATEDNWLVRKLEDDGIPASRLLVSLETSRIGGFTPLCHGPVALFRADQGAVAGVTSGEDTEIGTARSLGRSVSHSPAHRRRARGSATQ